MFDDKAEQEISKIPVSNYTIQRRIIDFSDNIEQNVIAKLKNCQFTLQINESTDISNHAQFIAFARVIDEGVIINQYLCCKNLPSTTKGQDVFDILTTHLKKHGLSWDSCVETGAELGGCQGGPLPPQNFAWPPSGPPNENVWLRPCVGICTDRAPSMVGSIKGLYLSWKNTILLLCELTVFFYTGSVSCKDSTK